MSAPDVRPDPSDSPRADSSVSSNDRRTIGEVIRAHVELRPKQAAIVGTNFSAISYQMLQGEIDEVRNSLRLAGFDRDAERLCDGLDESGNRGCTSVCAAGSRAGRGDSRQARSGSDGKL